MSALTLAQITQMPGTVALRRAATGVLLQEPVRTRAAYTSTVYGLSAGRVGVAPLARYRLPETRRHDTIVTEGDGDPEGVEFLPVLAAMADRIAPWVQLHIVPGILIQRRDDDDYGVGLDTYDVGGERFFPCGGLACYGQNLALVRLNSPRNLVKVTCHELMHVLWHGGFLNEEAMRVIRSAISVRPEMPGNYSGSESEAVAALFEGYALSRFFGLPQAFEFSEGMTVNGLMDEIWSGDLAHWLIARDCVPDAAALRERLGIPLHVQASPDPMPLSQRARQWVCSAVSRAMDSASSLVFERLLGLPAAV